jgi:DNA mismatch repair protein MutS
MPPDPRDTPAQHAQPSVSLLNADGPGSSGEARPACFADLNLDQIVAAATAGREQYELTPFFNAPLRDAEAVAWRQAVFRDLEDGGRKEVFEAFAAAMQRSREAIARAGKQRHLTEKQRWVLDALVAYCRGVVALVSALEARVPASDALAAFARFGADYAASDDFAAMRERVESVAGRLSALRYTVLIQGLDVRITPFADEADYGGAITGDFARFAQGHDEQFAFDHGQGDSLNMIEERILDHVARAFPDVFAELADVVAAYGGDFIDPVIARIDREAQFYLGWRALIDPIAEAGHPFCYPEVTDDKSVHAEDAFDLALAHALGKRGDALVHNDMRLDEGERIIIVSGPNQGGKTTFARMFGQLHYLAALGLPMPGKTARLKLFDTIHTHFERREVSSTADGKLQDELVRLHAILEAATGDSVVIMNELFASTTFRDASLLSRRVAAQLVERGVIGVWVSFLDGLSEADPALVSMVSQVDAEDPARRTFKVERRAADGLAYARAIARKYRLTREQIDQRLGAA